VTKVTRMVAGDLWGMCAGLMGRKICRYLAENLPGVDGSMFLILISIDIAMSIAKDGEKC